MDAPKIHGFTAYRQGLNHFMSAFNDDHNSVSLDIDQSTMQWPGFAALYVGGKYVTTFSEPGMRDGAVITACDGKAIDTWVSELEPYEGRIPGLESSRALVAPLVFRDVGSPFVPRPTECVIDGKRVALAWHPLSGAKAAEINAQVRVQPQRMSRIEPFGDDGTWITLQDFNPATKAEADSFNEVLAATPALRDKKLIVIDERNNGGGPYEWFMAFIRTLYGDPMSAYYARARLEISNVYRVTPEIDALFNDDTAKKNGSEGFKVPVDGKTFDADNKLYEAALRKHEPVLKSGPNMQGIAKPAKAPTNPVHAKVLVLTGYGCYSACIGFLDEMKRIPGVTQVGVETNVDSRTGTPFAHPLPSGNGSVRVTVMTRDNRKRGDNEPNRPDVLFDGNIQDTTAVKSWIQSRF
ncbi:hypothetical protein VI08_09705 [Luteibacter yeojuensis]|uniref:Tail specific protease domain-containing protein n=1 Tax=Luteibacter yeojuensis TaxID=345309 RepID=A0A0F3KXK0_9GAMM|nr:hypothetical protein VI08_09705 [Luteibacter yeojuensis]